MLKICKRLAFVAIALMTLAGCVPFVIGGYIGYEIAKDVAHFDWCARNVGDPSCHP